MMRPVQPIIEYYLQYDYFAKVLCLNKERPELKCNGQCILMQKLKKASQESQPEPFAPAASNFNVKDYPLALLTDKEVSKQFLHTYVGNTHYNLNLPDLLVVEVFHPPA
jgi:hypothetical protein